MALSKGFELAKLGSGLDVNQSTGEVVAISMDTDVVSEGTSYPIVYSCVCEIYISSSFGYNICIHGNSYYFAC